MNNKSSKQKIQIYLFICKYLLIILTFLLNSDDDKCTPPPCQGNYIFANVYLPPRQNLKYATVILIYVYIYIGIKYN